MELTEIITGRIAGNLDSVWTYLLLLSRCTALLMILPGLGMGERGIAVRMPAAIIFSFVGAMVAPTAAMPQNVIDAGITVFCEFSLGFMLGMIPFLVIAGVQMAGQLASTSMGLNAGNIIDPTLGVATADTARILGDLSIVLFMVFGGHHVLVKLALCGDGAFPPGTFTLRTDNLEMFAMESGRIFHTGVMIAAPVLVAMLLTNFVLGIIAKVVPSMNVFMISFPISIGIGLLLIAMMLPELVAYLEREFSRGNILFLGGG